MKVDSRSRVDVYIELEKVVGRSDWFDWLHERVTVGRDRRLDFTVYPPSPDGYERALSEDKWAERLLNKKECETFDLIELTSGSAIEFEVDDADV